MVIGTRMLEVEGVFGAVEARKLEHHYRHALKAKYRESQH